ncbi:hypothetical protein WDU94_014771 [Cyamophila willieti]
MLHQKHVIFEESEDTCDNENVYEDCGNNCDAIIESRIGNGDPCSETSSDDIIIPAVVKKPEDFTKTIKKKHKVEKIKRKAMQKECKRQAKEIVQEFKMKEKKRRQKQKEKMKMITKYAKEKDRHEKKCRKERERCEKKKEKMTRVQEMVILNRLKAKIKTKCIEVSFGDAEVPCGNLVTNGDLIKEMLIGEMK